MRTLVIAEHDHQRLLPGTLHAVTAAQKIAPEVAVLIAGYQCARIAEEAARLAGVHQVLYAEAPHYEHLLAEDLADLTISVCDGFTHLLAAATNAGKNFMPRVAALLSVAQISDITEVIAADMFKRPIYAGNALAAVQSTDPVKVLTVRTTAFERAVAGEAHAPIVPVAVPSPAGLSEFISQELTRSDRPELVSARVIVSGGRGLGSGENFVLLEQLADKLGAAIGASRAAVDAGFVPSDYQVGQTGKIVAPDLYIAIGISGAIQHLAGMKESRVIVAINKDPEAPIFQIADYGLVGDLFTVLPELTASL